MQCYPALSGHARDLLHSACIQEVVSGVCALLVLLGTAFLSMLASKLRLERVCFAFILSSVSPSLCIQAVYLGVLCICC